MEYEFKGNTATTAGPRRERTARAPRERASGGDRSLAQVLAAVFGLVFLLVGILGFVPGVTSDYDELSLLGTDSDAELLGLFRVSVVHNIVHMLFGVGLLAARRPESARAYLLGGGALYLVVSAYGLVIDKGSDANFLPVNHADNLLHVALSLALLGAGVVATLVDRRAASSQ